MSNDWWSRKMGSPAPRQTLPPTQQQQQPVQPPNPGYVAVNPTVSIEPQVLPPSALNPQRCPGCGSGNYVKPSPELKARCYDCGYPIQQSGSGLGKGITSGPQASGPAQPAKQVATGGFNPQTIIGHI